MNPNLIIDFDRTFVTIDALDTLSEISQKKNFNHSKPAKDDIKKLIAVLKKNITPSVKRNKEFFKKYKDSIYIVSYGFIEYVFPVVSKYGIEKNHVLCNSFVFDKKIKKFWE